MAVNDLTAESGNGRSLQPGPGYGIKLGPCLSCCTSNPDATDNHDFVDIQAKDDNIVDHIKAAPEAKCEAGSEDEADVANTAAGGEDREDGDSPFLRHVRGGRLLEARRLLDGGEATGAEDAAAMERVRRITDLFQETLPHFDGGCPPGWATEKLPDSKAEYSLLIKDKQMLMTSAYDFSEVDIIRGLIALNEPDLFSHYKPLYLYSKVLCEHHAEERMWQIGTQPKVGNPNDDISMYSCLDALDEPQQAIWQVAQSPVRPPGVTGGLASLKALSGVELPPPQKGAIRKDFGASTEAYMLKPVWKAGRPGLSLEVYMRVTLPDAVSRALSWLPSFAILAMARGSVADFSKSFREFARNNEVIDEHWRKSPRAALYDELEARVSRGRI